MLNKIHKLFCLTLLSSLTFSVPNPAHFIHAQGRPLNIAHRGLCSILPENTMEAFEAAMYQGADFIELDVVFTKEKRVLVTHDPFISRVSDVENFFEYGSRRQSRVYEGNQYFDWWSDSFTLPELKGFRLKQDSQTGRIDVFDNKFSYPVLDQVIQMVIDFNKKYQGNRNPDGRLVGILIEAKGEQMYRSLYGIEMGDAILQVLSKYNIQTINEAQKKCPIYLHSFDFDTVKLWSSKTKLPVNYLIEFDTNLNFDQISSYATGIGMSDKLVWDNDKNQSTGLSEKAKELGLQVHVWTFKDDDLSFNVDSNLVLRIQRQKMYEVAQKLLKLDGVITEFADVFAPIAQIYRKQQQQISKETDSKGVTSGLRVNQEVKRWSFSSRKTFTYKTLRPYDHD